MPETDVATAAHTIITLLATDPAARERIRAAMLTGHDADAAIVEALGEAGATIVPADVPLVAARIAALFGTTEAVDTSPGVVNAWSWPGTGQDAPVLGGFPVPAS